MLRSTDSSAFPSAAQDTAGESARSGDSGPSNRELVLLVVLGFVIFVAVVMRFRNFFAAVDNFGDSSAYMGIASAIRRWDFHGLVIKQFWGLPYLMVLVSTVTRVSDRTALLLISLTASVVSVILASKLWGPWVAGFFAAINFDWLQRSVLGGSEPLFVALLFGSFLAVRRNRWTLASLLAAFATTVRPMGIFALVGIGLTLLWRREFRKFAVAVTIGLAIGILYAIPVAQQFGDPLANVASYHNPQWEGGWLFGVPFYAIIKGTLQESSPWTNLVLSFGWVLLVLFAIIAMFRSERFRRYARTHLVEALFAAPYLWCLYAYNYPHWARGNFARFAIPIVPFVLLALYQWVPKDRRVLWLVGILSPLLAAASAVGVREVVRALTS